MLPRLIARLGMTGFGAAAIILSYNRHTTEVLIKGVSGTVDVRLVPSRGNSAATVLSHLPPLLL